MVAGDDPSVVIGAGEALTIRFQVRKSVSHAI